MLTTVVGSLPIKPRKQGNYLDCIRKAIELQAKYGIDICSDGQTRGDMIEIFARGLEGISLRGKKPSIVSRIEYRGPITLDDQLYAKKFLAKGQKLKGILTGPYTLACSCKKEVKASYQEVMDQLAESMRKEAKALQPHVSILQIDEPLLSEGVPPYAKKLVEHISSAVKIPTALHVCGDISDQFEKLLEWNVDILDHEFKSQPELLNKIAAYSFKQKIGYGSVQTKTNEVESVNEIKEHIEKGIKIFGKGKLLIDPDCGMRELELKAAKIKLRRMVKATKLVEKELG